MRRYRGVVNWSEGLRRFVEERIRELEAGEVLESVVRELEHATWSVLGLLRGICGGGW